MRLIDADELRDYFGMSEDCSKCKVDTRRCGNIQIYTKMDICSAIDEQPTVEPKQGEWETDKDGFVVCSNCKNRAIWNQARIQLKTGYCPMCGAKME